MAQTVSSKNFFKDMPLSIAILAVGGQGGAVLSGWLTTMAQNCGWTVQATSVPGVAQRTGATIYYIEIIKAAKGRKPVLGLMPTPGHVDVVVATEWMEAGRAIQRGLVSPEKTFLIASTHRALAVAEKIVPGDGFADGNIIDMLARAVSKKFVGADLQRIAEAHGSIISAATLGAIAGAGCLPFARGDFETAITQTKIGVKASLKAFDAAYRTVQNPDAAAMQEKQSPASSMPMLAGGSRKQRKTYQTLCRTVQKNFPESLHPIVMRGLNHVVDFQNSAYGKKYLTQLEKFHALDKQYSRTGKNFELTSALAKYLANAMSYQDVIRVADLKARASRFTRLRKDADWQKGQILGLTEFLHPRIEEMSGLFPYALRGLVNSKPIRMILGALSGGKRIRSHTLYGFLTLYLLGGLRFWRPVTIRHHQEMQHIDEWLGGVEKTVRHNYDLAVEIIQCRRLIKGYSDTHARGLSKYDKVMRGIEKIAKRKDAADWARRLRQAALTDAEGKILDGALLTLRQL